MIHPKTTFLAGLVLALGICSALIFLSLSPGRNLFFVSGNSDQDMFHRLLREYDASFAAAVPRENSGRDSLPVNGRQERMLNRLEKNARSVETWLSVLKRRRNLAEEGPRFLGQYRDAAIKAAMVFPHSEPLAALAAEVLLRTSPAAGAEVKNYTSRIHEGRLMPLVLGIGILAGDMENPERAVDSRLEPILAASLPLLFARLPDDEGDRLSADLGILRLLRQDIPGAAREIQAISAAANTSGAESQTPALIRFAAEYYYDFGDPLRSAALFSRLNDDVSMGRAADALWLGGEAAAAWNIWKILASTQEASPRNDPSQGAPSQDVSVIRRQSLYNLAATATDKQEEALWLERLFAEGRNNLGLQSDPFFYAGIIRYTRLLAANQALAMLEDEELQKQPLLDLELLRRRSEIWPADRMAAETWLLLGRHPEEAALYQWGAYFFDRQRKYDESVLLLKMAERNQISGPWLGLNAALRLIEEGRLDEAEERLRAFQPEKIWQINANLARLLEARRATADALENYETAASLVKKPESASQIQLRIAFCLQALGRAEESRRVLEYALDLDPDNLKARMELRKISSN
ncbi:hypothetical protein FACS189485_09210 [Spirochaetia bacterium]|nr:hypothetical protein FACS189485_09210 [Spirochaetia bacterium]